VLSDVYASLHLMQNADMRTTLDIDEPVLQALKELARRQGRTAGAVASELIHRALSQPSGQPSSSTAAGRHGFRPFLAETQAGAPSPRVTNEQVNRLRDEAGA
jgi:hypothetical protein